MMSMQAATQNDGYLTIATNKAVAAGSSMQIPVSLTNKIDIYGIQCDIYLSSSDISLKTNAKGKYVFGTNAIRVDGQVGSSLLRTDGSVRYMLADYTAENPFYENEGELFYININVAEGASGEYTLTLKGITLATDEGKILNDDIVCTLILPESDDADKSADEFRIANANILTKSIDDITSDDMEAVNNALEDYEKLPDTAKEKLQKEKADLDNKKQKADYIATKTFDINVANAHDDYFNVNGQHRQATGKGINIIRMGDGMVKKVAK